MEKKTRYLYLKRTALILISFIIFSLLPKFEFTKEILSHLSLSTRSLYVFFLYAITGSIPLIAMLILYKREDLLNILGLSRGFVVGICAGLVSTLPMFIGYAFIGEFNCEFTLDNLITMTIFAGFFEELFWRGFLFGLLFRTSRWGFISAVLVSSISFGLVHMYQGNDMVSSLIVAGVTGLGGALFSWIYVEWNYNLWVSISLHIFMNMSWMLFSVSKDAVGDSLVNIFRVTSILLVIVLTVIYKKRNNLRYQVNLKTLWEN